jgi:hypothetical protein
MSLVPETEPEGFEIQFLLQSVEHLIAYGAVIAKVNDGLPLGIDGFMPQLPAGFRGFFGAFWIDISRAKALEALAIIFL